MKQTVSCPDCHGIIITDSEPGKIITCPGCKKVFQVTNREDRNPDVSLPSSQVNREHSRPATGGSTVQSVIIEDIHMSVGSMMEFMLKWAIASVPAFIILTVVFTLVFVVVGGLSCAALH